MSRPFRFIAPMPRLEGSPAEWRDKLQRIEDLGYSSVAISDHVTQGFKMEPLATLAAAAMATKSLRLLTLVLGNDYRHPAFVHKAAATIDWLSGGRVELGLGAGWLGSDYETTGIALDPPATRVERLGEAVDVIRGLFGHEPFSYSGRHYHIDALDGLPKPVQQPHPPLLIGGGGRRILELAGRMADIAGIHARLRSEIYDASNVADYTPATVAGKVDTVRRAALAAGRNPDDIELQFSVRLCRITDGAGGDAELSPFGKLLAADPVLARDSPAVLVGSLDECVDKLAERRERYGLSYLSLGTDAEAGAPLVARLAGT
jgi:probable F420-dependent oxidoreductase